MNNKIICLNCGYDKGDIFEFTWYRMEEGKYNNLKFFFKCPKCDSCNIKVLNNDFEHHSLKEVLK